MLFHNYDYPEEERQADRRREKIMLFVIIGAVIGAPLFHLICYWLRP